MGKTNTPEGYLKWKLGNFLRGQYAQIKSDNSKSESKKLKELEALEKMTDYIGNYEDNIKRLQHYEELLQEQREHLDDGR